MKYNHMNNLRVPLLIVANMPNFIFSSDYFVWDCFVCFLGTILSGTVLSGTVLSVHR